MIPGELHILLERCRAEEAPAWDHFAAWVKGRGRAILGGVDKLSRADGDDAVAETLKRLVTVVRRGEIRGASNAEIDAYVCTRNPDRELNFCAGARGDRELDQSASRRQAGPRARRTAMTLDGLRIRTARWRRAAGPAEKRSCPGLLKEPLLFIAKLLACGPG